MFVPGVPLEEKTEALKVIEGALDAAQESLAVNGEELVSATFTTIGAYETFGKVRFENVSQIDVALTASEKRKIGTNGLVDRWAELIPPIAGIVFAVSPVERTLPSRAIEIELQDAPLQTLKLPAEEVARELKRDAGVSAILDDLPYGKEEHVLELSARGSAIGFTVENVDRQIRDLIEGATADRFVRDDEEVTIKVLHDNRGERPNLDLLLVNSPQGEWVPLSEVADIRQADSFAIIRHDEGRRTVTVSADVDNGVTSASRGVEEMEETFLKDLAARTGVTVRFDGQTRNRAESFAHLFLGLSLAGVFIYVILALVLESYVRPAFVMVISGIRICACRLISKRSGKRPKIVVTEVRMMARRRSRLAVSAAARRSSPAFIRSTTRSIRMMLSSLCHQTSTRSVTRPSRSSATRPSDVSPGGTFLRWRSPHRCAISARGCVTVYSS